MDAMLNEFVVWGHFPAYPHTDHPKGALGNERSVSFLGPQVLYKQTQLPPGERLIDTEDVYYTFADREGMFDKIRLP